MATKDPNTKVELSKGYYTLISPEDFERVSQFKWCYGNKYAVRRAYLGKVNGKYQYKSVILHRFIMNAPNGVEVDHINGDRLDNRRENLRLVTHSQNMQNRKVQKSSTTGLKGVGVSQGRYQAGIRANGIRYHLGTFRTPEEAHAVYVNAARKLHGEYART